MKLSRPILLALLLNLAFINAPHGNNTAGIYKPLLFDQIHECEGKETTLFSAYYPDTIPCAAGGLGSSPVYLTINPHRLILHAAIDAENERFSTVIAELPVMSGAMSSGTFGSVEIHHSGHHFPMVMGADSIRRTLLIDHCFERPSAETMELCIDINETVEYYHALLCTWTTAMQSVQHHERYVAFQTEKTGKCVPAGPVVDRSLLHTHS